MNFYKILACFFIFLLSFSFANITFADDIDIDNIKDISGIINTSSNVSENIGEYNRTYTGEVTNNSTEDLSMVAVIVIYKNGDEMIGGNATYVDDLSSGSTKPFEISEYSDLEYESFEIYALQW